MVKRCTLPSCDAREPEIIVPAGEQVILSRIEAAARLHCGLSKLAEYRREGRLIGFKPGRERVYLLEEVDALARDLSAEERDNYDAKVSRIQKRLGRR